MTRRLFLAAVGAATLLVAGSATACSTPVYRYAMYNWAPTPYYLFYLYRGQPAKEDEAAVELLKRQGRVGTGNVRMGEALSEREGAQANITYVAVDVDKKDAFKRLPEELRDAWKKQAKEAVPHHFLFSAWGALLYHGPWKAADSKALIESPVRSRLGALLHEGNAGVLLILPPKGSRRSEEVEKVVDETIARAASGRIPVADAVGAPAQAAGNENDGDTSGDPERAKGRLKVARLVISRDDPAEQWLLRALLAVENDLAEHADRPMVFPAYGRGRVMPPFIGKGITADNLSECVAFLAGACSCQVKDENPGVDLLMQWDWGATAQRLAADDEEAASADAGYREIEPVKSSSKATAKDAKAPSKDKAKNVKAPSKTNVALVEPKTQTGESVAAALPASPAPAEATPSRRWWWGYGLGLAVAAVVVVAAGVLVVRKQAG